jgi:ATPase subunit of ABC transporter with duplicated ATPase domains
MASDDPERRDRGMRRYSRADAELHAGGGYAAEAEARQMAASLGIESRVLDQPLRTLSGGQRRRVELARILFSGAEIMLLDEPTNHLDADSVGWLRDFLASYKGGLIVISHDVALLEACVNKVLHLDANRAEIDIYNMGWRAYLAQRETDEKRRKRERMNAENKAKTLTDQANKMRAKATRRRPRSRCSSAPRSSCRASRASAAPTGSPGSSSPRPRPAARPRSPQPSCRSPTGRSRCSPTWTSRSTAAAAW